MALQAPVSSVTLPEKKLRMMFVCAFTHVFKSHRATRARLGAIGSASTQFNPRGGRGIIRCRLLRRRRSADLPASVPPLWPRRRSSRRLHLLFRGLSKRSRRVGAGIHARSLCLSDKKELAWVPGMGDAASSELADGKFLDYISIATAVLLYVFIIYVSIPLTIRLFPPLLRKFVYLNFLVYPFGVDYKKPEVFLRSTKNFYLTSEPGVTFGIWYTLADNRWEEAEGKDFSWYEEALADDNPIIIYLHGNGGTRATSHRINFLKAMSGGGFHVLAVDYRGYADSTGNPSEEGFTTDVLCLYNWVKARSGNSAVVFWGHSLGTGIATNAARRLKEQEGIIVDAVILEAAYTTIRDAAATIPITTIYRKFPGFEYLILDTMARAEMFFLNNENVKVLSSPILILHSEDDNVIPIHHGKKLFEITCGATEKKDNITFLSFPSSMGLGHDHISSHPELASILKDFLKSIAADQQSNGQ
ncbi:protein ABHD12B [Erythrolamprus reginae]|uniref:protein ABHD12B n=1 Tax=Erythrolamprus reginae TaxID=121349 RepID=UPI00396C90A5